MDLTLRREDLKPEHKDMPCSLVKFEHFTDKAKAVIILVGRSMFKEWDDRNYNAIIPPEIKK